MHKRTLSQWKKFFVGNSTSIDYDNDLKTTNLKPHVTCFNYCPPMQLCPEMGVLSFNMNNKLTVLSVLSLLCRTIGSVLPVPIASDL